MNKKFAVPRGTSDILPDQVPLWENIECSARKVLKTYGYKEIRTPIYEETTLFKRSLGQTSDVVNKQLLELSSAKASAPQVESLKTEEGYALRPEGTASVVRSYLENSMDKKELLSKLFYIGPMFRGERPQKGRLRQFHQVGVEAIGVEGASPLLDVEILILAMHLLKEFGVQKTRLKINSLGSKEDKEHVSSWLRNEFAKHRHELCEDCQSRYERNVFRVLDCKNESCKRIVNIVLGKDKGLPLSENSRRYFDCVQQTLKDLNIEYEVSPHLVRGLDYYTHTVFEITAEGLGSQDAIGAGGRYSGLLNELGGDSKIEYGAIGFALGIERILLASGRTQGVASTIDAFIIETQPDYQSLSFKILHDLRQNGISAMSSFSSGSMKSQMNRANKANARFTLIIGEQEFKDQTVAVKDMGKSVQETVALKDVIEYLKNKLTQ